MKNDKKNFLVLGLGYFGAALAKKLYSLGAEVVAVDADPQIIASIANDVTQAIEMNPADETALKSLGISDYSVCIIARGSNLEDSMSIAVTLKENNAQKIIARAVSKKHGKILRKLDVDQVIFPEINIADDLALQLISPVIYDKIILKNNEQSENSHTDYVIELFRTDHKELPVEKYISKMPVGTKLIAIHRTENSTENIITDFRDEKLKENDLLLVWGPELRVKQLEK
ncbi:MAG: TrkA family potassium uptake protein [Armatimonadetes bacterium]|nr:TrkA family potassium uptake protein [Candidatus Hippobium faecium]